MDKMAAKSRDKVVSLEIEISTFKTPSKELIAIFSKNTWEHTHSHTQQTLVRMRQTLKSHPVDRVQSMRVSTIIIIMGLALAEAMGGPCRR